MKPNSSQRDPNVTIHWAIVSVDCQSCGMIHTLNLSSDDGAMLAATANHLALSMNLTGASIVIAYYSSNDVAHDPAPRHWGADCAEALVRTEAFLWPQDDGPLPF